MKSDMKSDQKEFVRQWSVSVGTIVRKAGEAINPLKAGRKKAARIFPGLVLTSVVLFSGAGKSVRAQEGDAAAAVTTQAEQRVETAEERNRRLQQLVQAATAESAGMPRAGDYRIGAYDLLDVMVFEAQDLSGSFRVSAGGEISLPLLGVVKGGGLTPRELELVLQELLRRTYVKDPHVGVKVTETPYQSISVVGAVNKPGVFQVKGSSTLLEVLSMAEGLADDAGDQVIVMRKDAMGPDVDPAQFLNDDDFRPDGEGEALGANFEVVGLKNLLDSGDPRLNLPVHPGDIVKVKQAGIVYVVGDVKRPGGFALKNNEPMTVLQAIALGEGLTPTADTKRSIIIRTNVEGARSELPINLKKILSGKAPDPQLQAKDIVFVPGSTKKAIAREGIDALVRVFSIRTIVR